MNPSLRSFRRDLWNRFVIFALPLLSVPHLLFSVPLDHWEYRLPSPLGENLGDVIFEGGQFLAVGASGVMIRSTDGIHWANATDKDDGIAYRADLTRVTRTGDTWFAFGESWVGAYGGDITSSDGVNWNHPTTYSNQRPLDVVFYKGAYYWIKLGDFIESAATTDGPRTDIGNKPSGEYRAIAASDAIMVIVGRSGFIMSSTDGSAWTQVDSGTTVSFANVEYIGDAFYALGDSSTILRSNDGTTWTKVFEDTQQWAPSVTDIARLGERFIVVGATGGTIQSTDGVTWAKIGGFPSQGARGIAAGNGRFVAVGIDGLAISSTDGSTWSGLVPDNVALVLDIATNGENVVLAPSGPSGLYSTDGVTWNASTLPIIDLASKVVWFKDHYIAGGPNGLTLKSGDGVTWETVSSPTASDLRSLCVAGDYLHAVFGDGSRLVTTDGTAWAASSLPDFAIPTNIAHGNGVYVMTTQGGYVLSSPDGAEWTQVPIYPNSLYTVVFGNGLFLGTGLGSLHSSQNGETWTSINTGLPGELQGTPFFTGDGFVLPLKGGRLAWSADLTTWHESVLPTVIRVRSAIAFKNSVIAITTTSQVIQSRLAPPELGLANISARAAVPDGGTLIAGFVNVDGQKELLVRGIGPSLPVPPSIQDPVLHLDQHGTMLPGNDDWGDAPDPALLVSVSSIVGAFALEPDSLDSALLVDLGPSVTTAVMSNKTPSGAALGLVEVYDGDGTTAGVGRLVNLSCRASVSIGHEVLIAGFVIHAGRPAKVLVRGAGPGLTGLGVAGAMTDPALSIFSGSTMIASNDNWGDAANSTQIYDAALYSGAFPFEQESKDAAVILYLNPGPYTAILYPVNGQPGEGLVEVYLLE